MKIEITLPAIAGICNQMVLVARCNAVGGNAADAVTRSLRRRGLKSALAMDDGSISLPMRCGWGRGQTGRWAVDSRSARGGSR